MKHYILIITLFVFSACSITFDVKQPEQQIVFQRQLDTVPLLPSNIPDEVVPQRYGSVRPDQAQEKTVAEDTDEIYSQYSGILRRIPFSTAKTYFQQGVVDSISLVQDSIIAVFKSGVETHRDTIAGVGGSDSGTDDQTISFVGTTLSIEDGNSVNLSSLQDGTGTDDQTAVEVPFTPTGNILSNDVQSMGEELQTQIDAIQSAFGISNGAQNLGTFTGSTISDNTTTKNALQELETAFESANIDYQVSSLNALALSTFEAGKKVWVSDIRKEFIIESSSYSDFTEDNLTVEQIANGNYAVLSDNGGVYYLSDFGITNNIADTTTNTQRLQRAINFAANKNLICDIDTFQITSSGGAIIISSSVDIDFDQSRIKVYPETATHISNSIFEVTHNTGDIFCNIKGGKFWGATQLGFPLDGTQSPSSLLSDAAFVDTEGISSYSAFVKMDSVSFLGLQPLGVQINSGYASTLHISNCIIEASRSNAIGAFGARRKIYAHNNKLYGASYNASDILGGQSFGVTVYFHPYVEVLEYKNNEHFGWYSINANTARSFQFSSGSAVYETTWPNQENYPVQYQEVTGNVFNVGSSDEKAIVTNWWYPKGVYKENVFLNDGNAYQLTAPCTIEGDYFSSDVNTAILFIFPSLNRDLVHVYEFSSLDVYSSTAILFDKDEGDSPVRGVINITGGKFDCSNVTFSTSNLSSLQDSSRIDLNVKGSYIISNSANSVLFNTGNLFTKVESSVLEISNSSARMFSINSNLTAPYGRMSFKQNTFLNPSDLSNPLFFYINSSVNSQINNVPIIYEDNVWPNEDNLGFVYQENNQAVRIPLSTGIYYDTISTATAQLNWNYNSYYINNSTLTAAYVGRSTPTSGIADPARMVGGDMTIIFTQNCTLNETGNFDLPQSIIEVKNGTSLTFKFNPVLRKWFLSELPLLNIELPIYADDSAAGTGGLITGDFYKTATGELRIKL